MTKATVWAKTRNVVTWSEHLLKRTSEKPGKSEGFLGRSRGRENESETIWQLVEGKVSQGTISCCQTWKCLVVLMVFQTCYTGMKSHIHTHTPPPHFREVLGLLRVHRDSEGLNSIPRHWATQGQTLLPAGEILLLLQEHCCTAHMYAPNCLRLIASKFGSLNPFVALDITA